MLKQSKQFQNDMMMAHKGSVVSSAPMTDLQTMVPRTHSNPQKEINKSYVFAPQMPIVMQGTSNLVEQAGLFPVRLRKASDINLSANKRLGNSRASNQSNSNE